MIRLTLIILALTVAFLGKTQGSFFSTPDSLNKGRLIGVSVGVGSVWAGSMIGLSQVWYADSEKTNWHAFDDSKDWLQMDKVGHYYTAYKLNQLTTDMFRWTGFNRRKSLNPMDRIQQKKVVVDWNRRELRLSNHFGNVGCL